MELAVPDDNELLQLVKQSDANAMALIYERYWRKLYAVAYYHCNSRTDAEDVVQEVLISLWNRRAVSDIQSLYSYLATATKYAIFHTIAKQQKQAVVHQAAITGNTAEESMAYFNLLQQQLQQAIDQLPNQCRLIFKYSREEGFTNREIAEQLNISQKAVEKQITKALKQLRSRFKGGQLPIF
jgi:RNA polymerase sigma-70 factor (ECF subfamily)